MKRRPLPPAEVVRTALDYDPETGIFTWKDGPSATLGARKRAATYVGATAGTVRSNGYVVISIGRKLYSAHRLAWLYVYGESLGEFETDHVNGDRQDNRIANLRRATKSQNMANMRGHSKLGLPKGVSVQSKSRRFMAAIMVARKKKYLGTFDTPEEAHAAYVAAAQTHHGQFARAE